MQMTSRPLREKRKLEQKAWRGSSSQAGSKRREAFTFRWCMGDPVGYVTGCATPFGERELAMQRVLREVVGAGSSILSAALPLPVINIVVEYCRGRASLYMELPLLLLPPSSFSSSRNLRDCFLHSFSTCSLL